MTTSPLAYCTIVARNYLAQALALHASIRNHEPDRHLTILVLDGDVSIPPSRRQGVSIEGPAFLGLAPRRFLELATVYDVVELATALKPLLLKRMLQTSERAVYLDPDMLLVSPLDELTPSIDASGGVLLTPHFLRPIAPGSTYMSEVHSLTVGLYNLGFCGVSRAAEPFLDWWWSHLENECLVYPLLGLFVDQKWVDIGSVMYPTAPLRHFGYNVGPWNLHERELVGTIERPLVKASGEPLRLFHFSGFSPDRPTELSTRLGFGTSDIRQANPILDDLCSAYAREVLATRGELESEPMYRYAVDSSGARIPRRVRRAFRAALLKGETTPPVPFVKEEQQNYQEWRRRHRTDMLRQTLADASIALKYAFPDEFQWFRSRTPNGFIRLRRYLLESGRVRR